MKKVMLPERSDWKQKAEDSGFVFHTMYGEPYWDETSAYQFTLEQVESDIEDPSTELHLMCKIAVSEIVKSEELMQQMGIPANHMDLVANSWHTEKNKNLYGRFDLAYDGNGPAKLLEYNADTPTSLYEASHFQWEWLEDAIEYGIIPAGSDQFNSIFEKLEMRFRELFPVATDIHFASVDGSIEDFGTVETLAWAANYAGMIPHYVKLNEIGISTSGQFVDEQDCVIGTLFKLYPWEDMLRDGYSMHIASSGCNFIEPAWKSLVSNKGILPVLWKMFPDYPNLLPAYFANSEDGKRFLETSQKGTVTKPIFSREGSSIVIQKSGIILDKSENEDYMEFPLIVQEYCQLPNFDGFRPIIGSWVVGDTCVGMGIREDRSMITQDLSRFKPHFII